MFCDDFIQQEEETVESGMEVSTFSFEIVNTKTLGLFINRKFPFSHGSQILQREDKFLKQCSV